VSKTEQAQNMKIILLYHLILITSNIYELRHVQLCTHYSVHYTNYIVHHTEAYTLTILTVQNTEQNQEISYNIKYCESLVRKC